MNGPSVAYKLAPKDFPWKFLNQISFLTISQFSLSIPMKRPQLTTNSHSSRPLDPLLAKTKFTSSLKENWGSVKMEPNSLAEQGQLCETLENQNGGGG